MKKALVGYTGFVGQNLLRQMDFTDLYNSKNSEELRGQSFDDFYFSAARAEKWIANANPEKDLVHINSLIDVLKSVKSQRAVLISTIDVYASPHQGDEKTNLDAAAHPQAYGRNRLLLENFFKNHFPDSLILRLPGLFGPGLKKNVIYDFLNNNMVEKIDSRGVFQFYSLSDLGHDIAVARKNGLQVLNLTTEPVSVAEIAEYVFNKDFNNPVLPTPARYNLKSAYSEHWNRQDGYLYSKGQVLEKMKSYVMSFKNV